MTIYIYDTIKPYEDQSTHYWSHIHIYDVVGHQRKQDLVLDSHWSPDNNTNQFFMSLLSRGGEIGGVGRATVPPL